MSAPAVPIPENELRAAEARAEALRQAQATPLPGPLREAFTTAGAREIYGLRLVPVVASHLILMQQLRPQPAPNGESQADLDPVELCELLFLLSRPPSESRSLLTTGREAYREAALRATADRIPARAEVWRDIGEALAQHLADAFATQVELSAREGDSPGPTFP